MGWLNQRTLIEVEIEFERCLTVDLAFSREHEAEVIWRYSGAGDDPRVQFLEARQPAHRYTGNKSPNIGQPLLDCS